MRASGVNIPDLEVSINSYMKEIITYLKDNSLLISASMSSITLLIPDTHQANTHMRIHIEDSQLPLVQCPKILGAYLPRPLLIIQSSLPTTQHKLSNTNNICKALAGTFLGQQKETLLMTYQAVERSIINYASPVWSPNLHDVNYRKIQYTQRHPN